MYVTVYSRAEKLKETADKCKSLGAKEVLCLSKDLHHLKANQEIVEETIKKFGSETCNLAKKLLLFTCQQT